MAKCTVSLTPKLASCYPTTGNAITEKHLISSNRYTCAWGRNDSSLILFPNQNTANVRLRRLQGNSSNIGYYIWPQVAIAQDYITTNGFYGLMIRENLEAYWATLGAEYTIDGDVNDGKIPLYLHATGATPPFDLNDRIYYYPGTYGQNYPYINWCHPKMLEYIFGGGSQGDGWIKNNYPVENGIMFCHDVFLPHGSHNAYETNYGVNSYDNEIMETNWKTYLDMFKEVILTPYNCRIMFNAGAIRWEQTDDNPLFPDVLYDAAYWYNNYAGGIFSENVLTKESAWNKPTATTWGIKERVDVLTILKDKTNSAAIFSLGNLYNDQMVPFRLRSTSGTQTYVITADTLTVGVSAFSLPDYTIDELVTAINLVPNIECEKYGDSDDANTLCTWWIGGVSSHELQIKTSTNLTLNTWTDGTNSPMFIVQPRPFWITLLALTLLSGYTSDNDFHVVPRLSQNKCTNFDWQNAVHLLGNPVDETYYKVNESYGDVYYRLYDNGVAFLNWEAIGTSPRVINASQFEVLNWYPLNNNGNSNRTLLIPNVDVTPLTNLTLSPGHGDIAFFNVG